MKKLFVILFIIEGFVIQTSLAQSPIFSQYNTANLYTNPATVGLGGSPFIGKMGYRDQWSSLNGGFQTQYASFEMNTLSRLNVGALISNDITGNNGLNTITMSGVVGYTIPVSKPRRMYRGNMSKVWYLQPAMQLGVMNKAIRSQYRYIDDINNGGSTVDQLNGLSDWFPELGFGLIATNKSVWFGFAAHHLFQTGRQVNDNTKVLTASPLRYTLHAGFSHLLPKTQDLNVGGSFIVRIQGGIYQGDFTANASKSLSYKDKTFIVGASLGVRTFINMRDEANRDALIVGTNVRFKNIEIGYSYDFTISRLVPYTLGTNEYSIIIYPSFDKSQKWDKKYKKKNRVYCPKLGTSYVYK
ncbi:PorP/SprF family type IX secretion system membrane protein [Flammeovirga sp. OC4]|uniref:PorP/SprF family type IX secretion system membrane protein n=1 Tax=Flammeovirga sp. OC4 TaxID=1382345 RepID=UPI0005C464B4|nr:PorP/SprF family type IX secretion system membrane protein [Flammeovirga sp. OC4]